MTSANCLKAFLVLLFFSIALFYPEKLFSQDEPEKGFRKDRIFWGGNLGAGFGTITNVDISPLVGYYFTPSLAAGIGLTYQYYEDRRFQPSAKLNVKGIRTFGRYFVFEDLFLHAEHEYLNFRTNIYSFSGDIESINLSSLLAGAGYRYAIGRKSYAHIVVLYNFTESMYSPYSNPVIRIGFDVGL